jgi:hypothetical protein
MIYLAVGIISFLVAMVGFLLLGFILIQGSASASSFSSKSIDFCFGLMLLGSAAFVGNAGFAAFHYWVH